LLDFVVILFNSGNILNQRQLIRTFSQVIIVAI